MQRDTVYVRYPDGKSRSVCLAVPLNRIRAAVARNLSRLHAPGSVASPPIEVQDAYHDDPFTMAEVRVQFGTTLLTGVGFAKRKASDKRNPSAGLSLAIYRAAWNSVRHLPKKDQS